MRTLELRTGEVIPQLGFGTFKLEGAECTEAVCRAIELGYRHIDTAFGYHNHREVAAGIRESGVRREDLFLTTKLPYRQQRRSQVIQAGQKLQDELATEYVDLLLIHWPVSDVPFAETLGAMGELVSRGVVRHIGVSNFNRTIMLEADAVSPVPIVTNQVEFHPYLYQRELLATCRESGILITAYAPVARGAVNDDPRMQDIATRAGASPIQVALAWLMSKGMVVIPKATGRAHLTENLHAAEVTLSAGDITKIDAFGDHRRLVDGPWKHFPLE